MDFIYKDLISTLIWTIWIVQSLDYNRAGKQQKARTEKETLPHSKDIYAAICKFRNQKDAKSLTQTL